MAPTGSPSTGLIASSPWEDLGQCPECCGYYYPYYPYYTSGGNLIQTCCCPNPLPDVLFATITGCEGGSYELIGNVQSDGGGIWNAPEGQVCAGIGVTSVPISFICNDSLAGPDACTFSIFFNDLAQGPFPGTLVSCDPFVWESDTINLDAFGCACGDFTVTVTE